MMDCDCEAPSCLGCLMFVHVTYMGESRGENNEAGVACLDTQGTDGQYA